MHIYRFIPIAIPFGLFIGNDCCPPILQQYKQISLLIDFESFDAKLGIVQKIDPIFYILHLQEDVALDILLPAEDLARKILLLGIPEDFSHHIFIQLFLEIIETNYK